MKKVMFSDLSPEIQIRLVKVVRLQDIQRSYKPTASQWQNASLILGDLFEELAALKAPHLDQIVWGA